MTTTVPKKLKADDYLQELAVQRGEGWLRSLIEVVISLRGIPEDSFLDNIYNNFLVTYGLKKKKKSTIATNLQTPITTAVITARKSFILKSLKHESGVNALEKGTIIPFHQKLTVVYGKNGSGKSGFVRILKRIAGSRTQEDIWQNVRNVKTQNRCKAKIDYVDGNTNIIYPWSGESRIVPFDQMAIFDGKCIPIYLNKSLGFSYQPYGFELFQAISASLQRLQEKLTADIQKATYNKPLIDDLFNKETAIGRFVASINQNTKLETLDKLSTWNQQTQKSLANKIELRKGLQNTDQHLELLHTWHQKVKTLEDKLIQVQSDLSGKNLKLYLTLIAKFNQLKKKLAAKKDKTLEDYNLPEMKSDEWGKFIEAGEKYINIAEHNEYPDDHDNCIYCRQKLSKTAQKLIQLYRKLYQKEKTSEYKEIQKKLEKILSCLENTLYAARFPYSKEEFVKFLPKKTIVNAFTALVSADNLVQIIATCLKGKKVQKFKPLKLTRIILNIIKARVQVESKMKELKETQHNFSRKSQDLDHAIVELQDVQKFRKYHAKVKKYIAIEKWITKATSLQTELNTKSITELGKKAWKEMVSDSFRKRFKKEATNLNAPEVDLEFRGEHGTQMREKSLAGLTGIDQFLSEGEQKAVALSDFFSELSIQREKTPVVFDDPATSFDHERKEKIAKRIVQESEARQIVIFTHDLMFASYLHDQVENANGNIDPSKAAFHDLHSEINRVGVVTENYYLGSVKFNAHMQRVNAKACGLEGLAGEAQTDGIRSVYGMLRKAVEKAVEERIFGGIITRWSDQIQMHNATPARASLNRNRLNKAKQLHEKFSRYIEGHDQSNEAIQHAIPNIGKLKQDIQQVKDIAIRT